jgi:hypothetical protein
MKCFSFFLLLFLLLMKFSYSQTWSLSSKNEKISYFRFYSNSNMWRDSLVYSNSGLYSNSVVDTFLREDSVIYFVTKGSKVRYFGSNDSIVYNPIREYDNEGNLILIRFIQFHLTRKFEEDGREFWEYFEGLDSTTSGDRIIYSNTLGYITMYESWGWIEEYKLDEK